MKKEKLAFCAILISKSFEKRGAVSTSLRQAISGCNALAHIHTIRIIWNECAFRTPALQLLRFGGFCIISCSSIFFDRFFP